MDGKRERIGIFTDTMKMCENNERLRQSIQTSLDNQQIFWEDDELDYSVLAKIRVARLFENIARIELEKIPRGTITISLGAVIVESKDGVIEEQYDDVYKRADIEMYKCKVKTGSSMSIEERMENEES